MPADFRQPDLRWKLELGRVEVIAQVTVNGKKMEPLWNGPFILDVTDSLQSGSNQLQVEVTNVWRNRLLAREQFLDGFPSPDGAAAAEASAARHQLWTSVETNLRPGQPLSPSGLIGPVVVRPAKRVQFSTKIRNQCRGAE